MFLQLSVKTLLALSISSIFYNVAIGSSSSTRNKGPPCPPELNYTRHCVCDFWPYETFDAYCNVSTPQDLAEITEAFDSTPIIDHFEVSFTFFSSEITIPKNVLSNKRAKTIRIDCMNSSIDYIDNEAFIYSEATVTAFEIQYCDLNSETFDFEFLKQFRMLHTLRISESTIKTFKNMPFLPHVQTIELNAIQGLENWYDPSQTPVVSSITINGVTETSAETVERIIETLYYYDNFLRTLYLKNLGLTRVPEVLRNFSSLNTLDLGENLMQELPEDSLNLMSSLSSLFLWNVPLRKIHPGAFRGNFRATSINLVYNNLTSFDREVFRDLLTDMMQASGYVYLYGSKFCKRFIFKRLFETSVLLNRSDPVQRLPLELAHQRRAPSVGQDSGGHVRERDYFSRVESRRLCGEMFKEFRLYSPLRSSSFDFCIIHFHLLLVMLCIQ